jgi:two-component system, NarL family, response regulator YdfI
VIRVVIAARSEMARAGMAALLTGTGRVEVVGSAPDVSILAPLVEEEHAEAALVLLEDRDAEPPPDLLKAASLAAVVILVEAPPSWVVEAVRGGVKGVLRRDAHAAEMIAALEAACAGLVTLSPEIAQDALAAPAPVASGGDPLTPREVEILRMLASGLANKLIAARLEISEHTVKFHVASIMGKLGAQSRTEAVTMGLRRGLIPL